MSVDPHVRLLAHETLDRLHATTWVPRCPRNSQENCILSAIPDDFGDPSDALIEELRKRAGIEDALSDWNDRQTSFAPVEALLLSVIYDDD